MEQFITQLEPWFQWLTRSTLQVSLLVCIILLVKTVLRTKLAPRWHYCLWLLVIARMLMPAAPQSSLSVFNLIPDPVEHTIGAPIAEIAQVVNVDETPIPELPLQTETAQPIPQAVAPQDTTAFTFPPLLDILPILWLIGAIVLAIYIFAGNFRLWSIVKLKRPVTNSRVLDLLEDCKSQMNIHTPLAVVETDRVTSPALFGFLRPRLLLPEGMLNALNPAQLRHILLHELAHLKRGDIYLGWLVAILQTVHWFNPIVWFGFNRMRSDRELACDNLALSAMPIEEPAEYGRTIVKLLENFTAPKYTPSLAGILEERSQLKRRITMIAKFKKGSYKFSAMAAVLFIVLSVVALTNAKGTSANAEEKKLLAESFTELLIAEKFEEATQNFDNKMQTALPAARLAEAWKATTAQAGPFQRQLGTRAEKIFWTDIIYVTCQFEEGPIDIKVIYNRESKVTGLWFVPVPQNVLQEYANQIESSGPIEIDTITDFLPGDSIEITQIFGTSNRIEPGQNYTIKCKYKLSSRNQAQIHLISTNGSTSSIPNPTIKRGRGEFTRTLNYIEGNKDAWLQLKFVPVGGNDSFGNLYFNNNNSNVSDITRIKGVTSIINRQADPQGDKPTIPIEIDTTTDFLPGDSIEITQILGTTGKIEPGHTYTIKGKYKLASQDKAKLFLYATNGETTCDQGSVINKGQGEFTRTFSYQEKGWLHLGLYSHPGNEGNFGNLYFNHKNGYVPDITKIEGMTSEVTKHENQLQAYLGTWEMVELEGENFRKITTSKLTFKSDGILVSEGIYTDDKYHVDKISYVFKDNKLELIHDDQEQSVDFAFENGQLIIITEDNKLIYEKKKTDKPDTGPKQLSNADKGQLFSAFMTIGTTCEQIGKMLFDDNVDLNNTDKRDEILELCKPINEIWPKMQAIAKDTEFEPVGIAGANQFGMFYNAVRQKNTELAKTNLRALQQLGNNTSDMFMKLMQPQQPKTSSASARASAARAAAARVAAASRRPATARSMVTRTRVDGNVAKLENGVTVEPVGICEHPSKGKQWWAPDGKSFDPDFNTELEGNVSSDGKPYEIAVKFDNKYDLSFAWGHVKGATGSSSLKVTGKGNEYQNDIKVSKFIIPQTLKETSVEVGIATGKWNTQFTHNGSSTMSSGKDGHGIAFSRASQIGKNIEITVSDDYFRTDYRLIAVGKNGDIHTTKHRGSNSGGKVRQSTFRFLNFDLKDIEEFRFQTRPYQWVTFENVSLRLGEKTNPKTTIETPVKTPATSAARPRPTTARTPASRPTTARATKTTPSPQQAAQNAMFLMEVLEKTFDSVKDSVDQGNTEAALVILETQKPHIDILAAKLGGFALADQLTLFTNQFMDVADLLKQDNTEKAKAVLQALAITGNELEDMVREESEKAKKQAPIKKIPTRSSSKARPSGKVSKSDLHESGNHTTRSSSSKKIDKQKFTEFFKNLNQKFQGDDAYAVQKYLYFENDAIKQRSLPFIKDMLGDFDLKNFHILDVVELPNNNYQVFTLNSSNDKMYYPQTFTVVLQKNQYKLKFFTQQSLNDIAMARTKSAEEIGRIHLEKQLNLWKSAKGEALQKLIKSRIQEQQRNLAAYQYAISNNLKLMPHLNPKDLNKSLDKLKNTPPDQLRQQIIEECNSVLKQRKK